jgi:hypothetical protein
MERDFHYATVSEAIDQLRRRGFTLDFNLEENCIVCHAEKYDPADFTIVDVYRYEGDSDPGDSAAVYALENKDATKRGILVTNYGANTDTVIVETLKRIAKKKPD